MISYDSILFNLRCVQAAVARIDILQNSDDKNFIIKLTQCRFKLLAWECCKVKWCPGQGVGGGWSDQSSPPLPLRGSR